MAKVLINDSTLSNMADEIRSQKGTQNTMTPDEMVTEVTNIGENTTATASDIVSGKTAITASGLTTGSLEPLNVGVVTPLTYNVGWESHASIIGANIKRLDFSKIDFSNLTSGNNLFQYLYSLEEVELFDTSAFTSMQNMFNACRSLKSVPLFNTANVTNMSGMFLECRTLTSLPLFNTANVTNFNYFLLMSNSAGSSSMYGNITSIPLFNTSSATQMSYFASNTKITSFPALNTSNVLNMSYLCNACKNLTAFPQLNTGNVTSMSYMFKNCSSLVTVPVLDTSKLTGSGMSNMFSSCTSLSNDSLNNILTMCANATLITTASYKTLKSIGLSSAQATICTGLSNYSTFTSAGWTTGY